MQSKFFVKWSILVFVSLLLVSGPAWAQFSSSVQGTVTDSTGAVVVGAKVSLVNTVTHVSAATTSSTTGLYRFLSLAPGSYTITVAAPSFGTAADTVTLLTDQSLNFDISLKLGSSTQTVTVTTESPVLNTGEIRNQQTLETSELSEVPLAGRNLLALTSIAPGVTGLGVNGGPGVSGGTPGTGVDNFNTEEAVDVSAKGQGTVSNQWIVDGLNVSSAIRQGVLNLTPNPDTIQEASNQVNTFDVEYGNASGIQFAMTTKSGTDKFHFLASDYFNNQMFFSKYSLPGDDHPYAPFHSNNLSFNASGPIIPHHRFFFFFSVEPLRSSASTGNQTVQYAAPQAGGFIPWAVANYPNTLGTQILSTFPVASAVSFSGVNSTAQDVFPGTCGTAATNFLPCSTAMTDNGVFNGTNFRNGTQYFGRADKYFNNDRIYFSVFRTLNAYGGPATVTAFGSTNNTWERAVQGGWTHTFSPTMLNELSIGNSRVQGINDETGNFDVPTINITGQNVGYGIGFAQGNFIQHNYHWRDVLTKVHGNHEIKVGYEGWFGDDEALFQGPWSHPTFQFNNLLALAQDAPQNETGVFYSPQTGQEALNSWDARGSTYGAFAQDTWKARRNLTVTLGFRFDNDGNPYSGSPTTVFGNFYLGGGSSFQEQVANGHTQEGHYALNSSPKGYNPRVGVAWDITGSGAWVLHGGFGMYTDALSFANMQEQFRGNPPGEISTNFIAGTSTPPLFVLGSTNTPPYGFQYPSLAGSPLCPTAPCLDAAGGIVGSEIGIGGEDPHIKSPLSYQEAATLEHRLGQYLVASVLWSNAHNVNMVPGGDLGGNVNYGSNINNLPGGLIGLPFGAPAPTLNPSFGSISYSQNIAHSNYDGVTFDLRGRYQHAFFDASYTRSSSKDDAGVYPTSLGIQQYYGPSPWDVPNRFSLSFNYQFTGLNQGQGALGKVTGGWGVSGTSLYQTGYPFNVYAGNLFNQASYVSGADAHLNTTGDYNADGQDNDFPNVTSYSEGKAYTTGVFAAGQFTVPTMGSEGNEKNNLFRNPGFEETDFSVYKDNHITERLNFQLRIDFYNLFNHSNYQNISNNVNAGNFGVVTSQLLPRWFDIGAKITF
jgi:Carboxypeptidase regulatory-like domain/TonB dependent receptor